MKKTWRFHAAHGFVYGSGETASEAWDNSKTVRRHTTREQFIEHAEEVE